MKSIASAVGGAILDPQQAAVLQADPDIPVSFVPGVGWDITDSGEEGTPD